MVTASSSQSVAFIVHWKPLSDSASCHFLDINRAKYEHVLLRIWEHSLYRVCFGSGSSSTRDGVPLETPSPPSVGSLDTMDISPSFDFVDWCCGKALGQSSPVLHTANGASECWRMRRVSPSGSIQCIPEPGMLISKKTKCFWTLLGFCYWVLIKRGLVELKLCGRLPRPLRLVNPASSSDESIASKTVPGSQT
jgi:hypothetical protein